jgi:hypothetical protein
MPPDDDETVTCASRAFRGTEPTGHPWPAGPWPTSMSALPGKHCDARRYQRGPRIKGNRNCIASGGRCASAFAFDWLLMLGPLELRRASEVEDVRLSRALLAGRLRGGGYAADRPRRRAPKGARQEPKPFRQGTDALSKSPALTEKHRASDDSFIVDRRYGWGRVSLVTFFAVKESHSPSRATPRSESGTPMSRAMRLGRRDTLRSYTLAPTIGNRLFHRVIRS